MKCKFENLGMNGQNSKNTKPADQYDSISLLSVTKEVNVSKYF